MSDEAQTPEERYFAKLAEAKQIRAIIEAQMQTRAQASVLPPSPQVAQPDGYPLPGRSVAHPRGDKDFPWPGVVWGLVAVVAVVALVLKLSGHDAATTTSAAASSSVNSVLAAGPAAVGQQVSFQRADAAGTAMLNSAQRAATAQGPLASAPTNGSFLIVDVTITCSKGKVVANPLAFSVKDRQGYSYNPALGAVAQQVDSSDMAPGDTVRGQVAFDVPPGPMTLTMRTPLGDTLATWSIPG